MMKYYQEVSLISDAEITLYFIWQKLYQQIHFALAENKTDENESRIGVAFPGYDGERFLLGTKLRLFAEDEQSLKDMQCEKWLSRLCDYVHVKPIATVPEKLAEHACFRHVKMKGSKEKLARRRAKRKGETLEQALKQYENYKRRQNNLPYINVISQTNGQRFRLFIEKQTMNQPQKGAYSCYGLSNTTTVPLF
jgi:CRISPR-associated endonuclease Csy4